MDDKQNHRQHWLHHSRHFGRPSQTRLCSGPRPKHLQCQNWNWILTLEVTRNVTYQEVLMKWIQV